MGSYVEEVGIRLRADGVIETSSGIELTGKSLDQLGRRAHAAAKPVADLGQSVKQTQQAFRLLPVQITDAAVSLASGQPAFLVAIQQGAQIKDSFGGAVPMVKALAGALGPLWLSLGAVATMAATVGGAYYNGWQQSREFQNALALTGNQAGITEGQFNGLVEGMAAARNVGTGAARELMQAVVSTGQQSTASMEATGRAALALSKLNGQAAVDNVRAFNGMADGVTAWAVKANRSYAYLTAEQFKQIQTLESQGRTSEAVRLNMQALSGTLEGRTAPSLGLIERSLKAVTKGWSDFWDAASGIGRPQTVEGRLAEINRLLADPNFGNIYGGGRRAMEAERQQLQREAARSAMREADAAAQRQADQEAVYKASREYQDTVLGIATAAGQRVAAAEQQSLQQRQNELERAYAQFEISGQTYTERVIAIERQRVAVQEQLARQAVQIEQQRVTSSEAEANQKTAAIAAAEARLIAVRTQRLELDRRVAAGEFAARGREVQDDPREAFRRSELGGDGNRQSGDLVQARINESKAAAQEVLATNRQLSAELITNERARAQALLAIEAQQLRERLALNVGSVEERREKEETFAQWMVLRQRKLTEDLKPEWQRMLEAWADTNQMIQDSNDRMFTNFLQNGEEAFVQLVSTGRVSAKNLVSSWLAEMARLEYRKFMASLSGGGSSGGGLLNLLINGAMLIGGGGMPMDNIGNLVGNAGYGGVFHGGGMVASDRPAGMRALPAAVWRGAPRFHTGVGPDELPAVLHKTEGVFTAGQMRALAPVDELARAAGPRITFAPTIQIDSRTDRAEVYALVQNAMQASQQELLDNMSRRMT